MYFHNNIVPALKVNGQKMCDLAREGKADSIKIKSRKVNIERNEILSINGNKILFLVKCSRELMSEVFAMILENI